MKRKHFLVASCILLMQGYFSKSQAQQLDVAAMMPEKFDKENVISFDEYNNWGTNILKGKDGKYHAIYSRWRRSRGHMAWVTHSEVAHAVSDKLTGPYVFKNMALPARGREYWDGDVTHNPHVIEHEGKYYLYYMGNHGSGYWDNTPNDRHPEMSDKEWWVNRNNQRVGVAVADDLNGVWKRYDKPLIDIDSTQIMTSTPTVSKRPDGKFLLVYKYVTKSPKDHKGAKVIHVTALGDTPLGPFKLTNKPFITHPTAKFALDDHVEWFQDGHYYCIAKDSRGVMSEHGEGATLLYVSDKDGLNWKKAEKELVLAPGKLRWTDGTETLCDRTADMPKLYMENGIPKALIIASLIKDGDDSFVTVIPLDNK